ncbi:nitrous oxide reductase accessory protein NosL [Aeribacillus sp. FSL M8-0235]|uniref:nitrous oxide reductase accessory protein NosL n=1 Tax=Aeribacillus sp. FSL M8-0235 TaxID=2954576 RepID=UPI0030F5CF66
MKKKLFSFYVIAVIAMIIAACGNNKVQPVSINESTDTCETCNMAVADNQYATQILLKNGKSLIFDDIGCMYEWINTHKDEEIEAKFVRDYNNKKWILSDDATYVYNQSINTPMAYNIISFQEKASAEKFVAKNEGSKLLTASDLADHSWKQNHDMLKKHGEEGHSNSEGTEKVGHSHSEQDHNSSH